jgi:ParB-like chromosome segregation protein Spo0J
MTYKKLSEIKPNPDNPRVIRDENFKKLVNSIKEFPEMLDLRPIVVNKDMVILGGNMRYRACKEAGFNEVPVVVADNITKEQEREFIIKDNVSGGDWDWEILANEWNETELDGWGLDIPYQQEETEEEISYHILIECTSQEEQMSLYSELENKGVKAKMK